MGSSDGSLSALIVGGIAKAIMPGKDPGGILVTMVLGVVGAFAGGLLGNWIFGVDVDRFCSLSTWVLAVVGSVIVLGVYRVIVGRKAVERRARSARGVAEIAPATPFFADRGGRWALGRRGRVRG